MLENIKEIDDSDFRVWIDNPVTRILLKDIKDKITGAENYVINNVNYDEAGVHYSFYMKGGIAAYKEIISYNFSAFDELRKLYLEEVENDKANRHGGSS